MVQEVDQKCTSCISLTKFSIAPVIDLCFFIYKLEIKCLALFYGIVFASFLVHEHLFYVFVRAPQFIRYLWPLCPGPKVYMLYLLQLSIECLCLKSLWHNSLITATYFLVKVFHTLAIILHKKLGYSRMNKTA